MTIPTWQERYQARAKEAMAAHGGFTREQAGVVRSECKNEELADYKRENARLRAELAAQSSILPKAPNLSRIFGPAAAGATVRHFGDRRYQQGIADAKNGSPTPNIEQMKTWAGTLGYQLVRRPKRPPAPSEANVAEWQCCGTYSPCRAECIVPVEKD